MAGHLDELRRGGDEAEEVFLRWKVSMGTSAKPRKSHMSETTFPRTRVVRAEMMDKTAGNCYLFLSTSLF